MGYNHQYCSLPDSTIMIEPEIDWQWHFDNSSLRLRTRQGLLSCSVSVQNAHLAGSPAFTLQQAEWFWLCRHALEPLGWSDNAVLCACIDAVAQLSFTTERGDKSFYLQAVSTGTLLAAFSLVQILGQNHALALVLEADNRQSRVMLLSDCDTLTGRTLTAGRTLLCRPDRLLPLASEHPALAKSA